jgi:hypothetical protein
MKFIYRDSMSTPSAGHPLIDLSRVAQVALAVRALPETNSKAKREAETLLRMRLGILASIQEATELAETLWAKIVESGQWTQSEIAEALAEAESDFRVRGEGGKP